MDTRQEIETLLVKALKDLGIKDASSFIIERPKNSRNGDWSTNIAMALFQSETRNHPPVGGLETKNPNELAVKITELLNKNKSSIFEKIEVAGSGFINFYLSKKYLQDQIGEIIKKDHKFGSLEIGKNKKASVEYVSANPTGPLHIGNARGGPIGDVLANVLEKAGYKVEREYLQNDAGWQIISLGKTIYNTVKEDDGKEEEIYYKGEYVKKLALKVCQKVDINKLSKEEFVKKAGEEAVEIMLLEILETTKAMGINYDSIRKESGLKKDVPQIINRLQKQGIVKEKDGALWFAPHLRQGSGGQANDEFLKDRETVVRKSNGEYTYFASDIVYHSEKFNKGNDLVIDIWGSDHSGHIPRMQAAIKSLDFDPSKFKVILYQFVRIKRGNELLKMSKRAGNFITAKEVLDEVGKDAFRFFMLMHKAETHMDFDLELAKKKASDNPVFYVQYAYSRICSIFAKAGTSDFSKANYCLLNSDEEVALTRYLIIFPELVEEVSRDFSVHLLTSYAIELASLFHRFYEKQVVILEDKELTNARLALLKATQIVLKNTLDLLGINPSERM